MSDRYKGAILSPTAPTVIPQSAGGVYTLSQQLQYQGQGVWPSAVNYPITKSLRFRSSASAYLNRTPASATNRTTWTYSYWFKGINTTGSVDYWALSAFSDGNNYTAIRHRNLSDIDVLSFNGGSAVSNVKTAALFRDPAAWYHMVIVFDTSNATQADRIQIYQNGVRSAVQSSPTYPGSGSPTGWVNSTAIHYIGRQSTEYFEGYMAEIHLIDGQALTPSSFGTTDAYGVWQPIRYSGTYGTNGFYLPFTDTTSTSTLGTDFSGNSNTWTVNNISLTSGSTYDSMTDVPTLTSATTANYATLNPITGSATLSNGNLAYTSTTGTYYATIGTVGVSSGKWYWEVTANGAGQVVGICGITNRGQQGVYVGSTADSYGYYGLSGDKYNNGSASAYGATYTTNDVIGIALDMDAGTIVFYKNNASQGTAFSGLSGTFLPMASNDSTSAGAGTFNFGQRPFSYTAPSGFYPLNTYNLPTPTILDGDQYMNVVTRTFTGASATVSSLNFRPDFLWFKNRTSAASHSLYDYLRGTNSRLLSNGTNAEITTTSAELTSFNSNGFTVGADGGNLSINGPSGDAGVVWAWNAGSGTSVSNTQGTITSTVSANTTAGFSIVTWTGNGASSATIGHGLGVAPSMIIVKNRSATWGWFVYNRFLTNPNTGRLQLNLTNGEIAGGTPGPWNNTAPTSTVFSLGDSSFPEVNGSGNSIVAYCFSAVAGYSAFGSYTGNGSTDGPFVFTGFRPRWILIKVSSGGTGSWLLYDTARNTYNVSQSILYPNLSNAEATTSSANLDILSNGFKLRTSNADFNGSTFTYIYACFAENPFKIANAR